MTVMPPSLLAQDWLDQIFRSKSATTGGVLRRKVSDVHREVGREVLELEVRRRGWHLLHSNDHYIILCSPAPFSVIC
ncbi:N-(5'-phosphoribosyl)anthranilate isomerase [Shimia sediminis]|uniref:N-(5'-phosphoribosyl)anthranilate isomerase n=1 Tax=Shimia sediminis TaxID=2497945 RepID=UPI000F8CC4F6|nr:N-(5'-phosphoribosyl)anthranilate isomerase [Shimia sediminis]